jgi:hypothetical protein
MPIEITDGAGFFVRNDSEYRLDPAKVQAWPPWLDEVEGYRDRHSPTDSQTTRFYRCPWSRRKQAREYLLGYSTVVSSNPALAPNPALVTFALSRVLPAQDPEEPWLFCDDVETMRGEGAVIQNPLIRCFDKNGAPVGVADVNGNPLVPFVPLIPPCASYVDNSQGGAAFDAGVGPIVAEPNHRFSDGRALLRATFRPRNYSMLTDAAVALLGAPTELHRYVERDEEAGMEALPLAKLVGADPALILKFAGPPDPATNPYGGSQIPEAGVKQLPLATLNYVWHDVPDPPRSIVTGFRACLGKVNSKNFDGFGGAPVYPPETLLCLPWRLQRKCGPTGRIVWRVGYRLAFRPQTWNRFPAGDGNFYLATFGGDVNGDRVYSEADFDQLFGAPQPVSYLS